MPDTVIASDDPAPRIDDDSRLSGLLVDWSGTIVDFGARAPVAALQGAFEESSVPVSEAEARAPMGTAKWEHIRAVLAAARVSEAWRALYGRGWMDMDVDMIYERFLPLQAAAAREMSVVIPGAAAALEDARARGMKVGSTSGYPQKVMDAVMARAAEQGLSVDTCACAGDTLMGRPMPFMLYKVLLDLELGAVWKCVVVDDTPLGIAAARNAGAWAVGVSVSGNQVGLSLDEWRALDHAERMRRRRDAGDSLKRAGAHFVIDTIAGISAVLTRLESRLARGERP